MTRTTILAEIDAALAAIPPTADGARLAAHFARACAKRAQQYADTRNVRQTRAFATSAAAHADAARYAADAARYAARYAADADADADANADADAARYATGAARAAEIAAAYAVPGAATLGPSSPDALVRAMRSAADAERRKQRAHLRRLIK